jgi:hypothetical protein
MYPNTRINRFFVVIGFIYLTMCPHAYDVNEGSFKYSAIGSRVQSVDQRSQREGNSSMPHLMAVVALGRTSVSTESTSLLCHVCKNIPITLSDPLSTIKLRL